MLMKAQISFSLSHWQVHGGETGGFGRESIVSFRGDSRVGGAISDGIKCATKVNEMSFAFARAGYLLLQAREEGTNAMWMECDASV